jgi:hypothetical protein
MASTLKDTELCYLLAFPDEVETPIPAEPVKGLKNAPYFQPVDIRLHTLGQESLKIDKVSVAVLRQRYDDRVQMVECRFKLPDALGLASIQQRQKLEETLQERLIPAQYRANGLFEVYLILLVKDNLDLPEEYVQANAENLARFIRSQREILDASEIQDILVSRVSYSKGDLTLVDWEAAIIFAPAGDFQSDVELLKIGNYQLLRYRILDQSTEEILQTINKIFKQRKFPALGPTRGTLRDIVSHRLELMLSFEHNEQNLLLIGDWYTAKLYHLISDEFYLNNWKEAVQTKLDNLENIIQTIQENFTLSWQSFLDYVQLAGWLVLLIGYFILYFWDVAAAK